jgi:flagellar motor switch protein FliN/FliY
MSQEETTAVVDEQQAAETPPADPSPSPVGDEESAQLVQDLGGDVPDTANLDMLLDVGLQISVELGRARLKFRDVLNLAQGSVIELSRQTSEPVDILVNGALLATGEVVVVDDHFAVRITKLLNRVERLKRVL